jgi:5-methyltetrahydrofolate--homocysteine methyltransferase
MKTFAEKVRVTDGVYGTELQKEVVPGGCTELMNIESPQIVEAVAKSYVKAGSDIIMTNTLGAHRFMLSSYGIANRASELAEAGAAISRKAAEGTDAKVFGSFGPSGRIVMMGEVDRGELSAAFAETAQALVKGGADAIVLETFSDIEEAQIALEAVKAACNLPVVVSLVFAYGPEKTMTMMGNSPAQLAAMAEKFGADAVGANCGIGPESYIQVTKMLREATELPIWVKPNAGLPEIRNGRTIFPMGPEKFASFAGCLIDAGANFIGGCCGCGPEHIRAIREIVDKRNG